MRCSMRRQPERGAVCSYARSGAGPRPPFTEWSLSILMTLEINQGCGLPEVHLTVELLRYLPTDLRPSQQVASVLGPMTRDTWFLAISIAWCVALAGALLGVAPFPGNAPD